MTTVHVVALPHLDPVKDVSTCAYSNKIRRLGGMLRANGHRAVLYAGERSDGDYDELVTVVTEADRRRWFGEETWRERVFDRWDPADPAWAETNTKAIAAIRERWSPHDVVGISMGRAQGAIADAFSTGPPGGTGRTVPLVVEMGVGYEGVLNKSFRVFESHAWRTHVAGLRHDDDFRAFDAVIPNSWEPSEFPDLGDGKGGYYLFIGRLFARKGPQVAAETCRRIGARLIVAGQGVAKVEPGRITTLDGTILEGDVEYVGIVGPQERATLMGGAIATFVPTQYAEPFGGVAVESMLTGTPPIATAWGAFPETIRQGETGFLCSTLAEFVAAAKAAPELIGAETRAYALSRFSTDVVGPQYAAYLARLATLWGDGWYAA